MSPEVAAALWTGGITISGSLLTLLITNKHSSKQMEKQMDLQIKERELQSKELIITNSYEHRVKAYSNLFAVLYEFEKYFYLFTEPGNEFKKSLDPNQFKPFSEREKLMETYVKESLWLTKRAEESFQEVFYKCDTAISLAVNLPDEMFSNSVEGCCDGILNKTAEVKKILKRDLGITDIDEHRESKEEITTNLQEVSVSQEH